MQRLLFWSSLVLMTIGATQFWEITGYDGYGPPPPLWPNYIVYAILPFFLGLGMLVGQDYYRSEDLFDHIELIIEKVPWPRWSTLTLLGLALLFGLWSYSWQAYNTFTGVVAGALLFTAVWRSLWRAIRREQRRVQQARRRAHAEPLPWVL